MKINPSCRWNRQWQVVLLDALGVSVTQITGRPGEMSSDSDRKTTIWFRWELLHIIAKHEKRILLG
jgi:hypothetical protein